MADKKPQRYIVPVECTQPIAKPNPWEDTWESINNFSPERTLGVKEQKPTLAPRRHQSSSQTSPEMVVDEDGPPPSTESHCTTYDMSALYGDKSKVSSDYFCSIPYLRKTLAPCPVRTLH